MSQTTTAHRRTRSEPEPKLADSNPTTQCLLSLVKLVQGIASHESFTDFEALTQEFCSLKERDKAYAQQVQKLEGELEELRASSASKLSDLNNQHRLEYGNLLKTHHELAAQMDVEKKSLEDKLNIADHTIEEKDHEVSKLQSANSDLTLQAKQLISKKEQTQEQLVKSQEEVKGLLEKINGKDDTVQKYKEKLAQQGDTIRKYSSDASSLRADLRAARTDLKEATEQLTTLRGFGVPLQEDSTAQAVQRFDDLWKHCITVVLSCFETNLPGGVLQDTTALSNIRNTTYIKHQLPLPPSNSIAAKSMRFAIVLALISQLLVDEVFKSTNLVQGDTELRRELCFIAQENPNKEAFTRALLISLHDQDYLDHHISKVAQLVYRQVKELLEPNSADIFRKEVHFIFKEAAGIWRYLQLMKSHFAVDLEIRKEQSGSWKSINFSSTKLAFEEQDMSADGFESDAIELRVFPRMYISGPQGETPVFPGRVLQRSQITSAKEELAKRDENSSLWDSTTAGIDRRRPSQRRGPQPRQNGGAFLGSDIGQQRS